MLDKDTLKPYRIVVYPGGLYPSGLLRDRQAKVNTLRELQSASGDASQVVTPFPSLPLARFALIRVLRKVRFAVPLNGEGEWSVFMKREIKKPLDQQRRIVAYLDGWPPVEDL